MSGFFKNRGKDKDSSKTEAIKTPKENLNSEPEKVGLNNVQVNPGAIELNGFLYEYGPIDNCYRDVTEGNVNSEGMLQLCKEVNSKIKDGSVISDVASFTVQTLAFEILKVYCLITKDDMQQDINNINNDLKDTVNKLKKAQTALNESESECKNLKVKYEQLEESKQSEASGAVSDAEREKYEKDIKLLEDTIENYQKEIEEYQTKLKDMSDSLDKSNKELIGLNQNLDKLSSASADTVDERFQELLKDNNAKDLEIAKLNSNIITINRDLKQARNDAKTREYNTAAITGLKGSIAMLTEDIEKTTSELMNALDEVARLQQEAIVKDQEIVAYKAQNKSLRAKAQIAVKTVMSGEMVEQVGRNSEVQQEVASSLATENIEREIGNLDVSVANDNNELREDASETLVEKEPQIIVQGIEQETVEKLMVAAMQLRGMQRTFTPAYRNDIKDQLNRLVENKDSFVFNLGEIKVELERIFADVISAE